MSSQCVFTRIHEMMCAFHSHHQQALLSMHYQCSQAKTVTDLHRLAIDIHSLCENLHMHHTIEDHHVFPQLAQKINISHLEVHHDQLAQILIEFENFSRSLKRLTKSDENAVNQRVIDAISLINQLSTLVNDHERAEEQVLEPSNMKKYFDENELKRMFHI